MLTRLKYWRQLRGLSIRELAIKAGVSNNTIVSAESLTRLPQPAKVRALAEALDVELPQLYAPDHDFSIGPKGSGLLVASPVNQ
jgi:transcriptional regulator with XRE-family HTH domain